MKPAKKKFKEKNEKIARKNVLRRSKEASGVSVKGYNFNEGVNYEKMLDSYASLGLQASNFSKAVEIINNMIKNKAYIYIGYTSNMVTSGLREVFRWLAEHKKVDVIVTTAGGIEEDIIKCLGDFKVGSFRAKGDELRKRGINRAGNIFIPNSRYCDFEDFILPIFKEFYDIQLTTGKVATPSELAWKLGEKIDNKNSIYYWCWKNKIPVFCPAITDGSIGDMIYFFKSKNPDFKIDVAEDIWKINSRNKSK